MGSSPCRRISLLGIIHPIVGKYFHWRYTGGGNTSKRFVVKKAGLWLFHVFCNILDRISSFILVNEKFCNKNFFLDLLSLVLIDFPHFPSCRICIEAVVLNEMHWKRIGSA